MPPSRVARFLAATAGVALLVAVAYFVAGSRGEESDAWVGVPEVATDTARDLIVAAVLVASILVTVLVVRAMFARVRLERFGRRNTALFAIVGLVLTVVVVWAIVRLVPEGALDLQLEVGDGPAERLEEEVVAEPDSPVGVLVWFVVLSAGLGGWAVISWMKGQRGQLESGVRDPKAELRSRRIVLAGLLDDAIARLRDHPDPREATIATWARLETALEAVGVPRQASDTPTTYLSRVLDSVEASGPAVKRLTTAYERAMYSPHRIHRDTQLESVDALVAVRDELRVLETAGRPVRA